MGFCMHTPDVRCPNCADDSRRLDTSRYSESGLIADLNRRIATLEAENAALRSEVEGLQRELKQKELIHLGYTNAYQIEYAKDESGSFYPDTENECYIPVYMLANHKHRAVILEDAFPPPPQEEG